MTLATGAVLCGSTAVAAAAGVDIPMVHPSNGDAAFQQRVGPISKELVTSVGVLGKVSDLPDAATVDKLRDRLGADTGSASLSVADFARTRAVTASGIKAYVIPSGEKVCLILPDANDSLSGTCSALDAVERGEAFVLTPLPSGKTLVVALVANDQPGPTITGADGSLTQLPVTDNVAAGLVPSDGHLQLVDQAIPLAPPPATVSE